MHLQVPENIRVVLADDHAIVREGVRLILEKDAHITIVGMASDGLEALQLVKELQPAILLCDISMPAKSGIEVAKELTKEGTSTRILFLSMQDKEEYILEAMQAGASGFLPKAAVGEELLEAIRKVASGQEYFSEAIYAKAFKAIRSSHQKKEIHLTPRELEVLQLLAKGLSTKMIAEKLFVSEFTISNHRANLLRKLSAQNVAELIRKALELNLINP